MTSNATPGVISASPASSTASACGSDPLTCDTSSAIAPEQKNNDTSTTSLPAISFTPTSRYSFHRTSSGFVVEGGPERVPVKVGLEPHNGLLILVSPVEVEDSTGYSFRPQSLGLYDFKGLLSAVASGLMASWRPNNLLPFPSPFSPIFASSFVASTTDPDLDPNATPAAANTVPLKRPWVGVYEWAYAQTAKALYPRLYREWQHMLESVDPHQLRVIRAVSLANYGSTSPGPETWLELYSPQYAYLRADIGRFRAAAIACRRASELVLAQRRRAVMREAHYLELVAQSQQEEARLRAAGIDPRTVQPTVEIEFVPGYPFHWPLAPAYERYLRDKLAGIENNPSVILTGLAEWRTLFSGRRDGRDYRSLNRTLTHLPGGIPPRLLGTLGAIELERPVTDRVELLTLLLYAHIYRLRGQRAFPRHLPLFMHATRSHIETALTRFAAHTQQPPLKAKTKPLEQLVGFLADYPYEHRGNLVGLTDRAIEWHQALNAPVRMGVGIVRGGQGHEQGPGDVLTTLPAETLVARPPIELPAPHRRVKGNGLEVRFLAKVGDILEEGRVMGHCIASYTNEALAGECYLFHVEYRGERASVQVAAEGYVTQSFGPLNRRNEASERGRQVLGRWGKTLRKIDHTTTAFTSTKADLFGFGEVGTEPGQLPSGGEAAKEAELSGLIEPNDPEGFDLFSAEGLRRMGIDPDEPINPEDLPF